MRIRIVTEGASWRLPRPLPRCTGEDKLLDHQNVRFKVARHSLPLPGKAPRLA
jgi:hypothetical protein